MQDQQQLQPRPAPKKKGFFESLSFFQKVLLFIFAVTVLFAIAGIALGGIKDFYQFFFYLSVFVVVIIASYLVIKATGILFTKKMFSPREDLRVKLLNMARDYKPDNLNNLYFTGDVGKKRVLAGKIVGCLGLPYYSGKIKTKIGKNGKTEIVYTKRKDFAGKQIPEYENITMKKSGDTLFIVRKGLIFVKKHFIRCRFDLHSTLNGDVEIYDINPSPYGFFEYPYKQMQETPTQIMIQNQIETILATHEHQHDLISQSVDSAIYFNPVYQYAMRAGAEIPEE